MLSHEGKRAIKVFANTASDSELEDKRRHIVRLMAIESPDSSTTIMLERVHSYIVDEILARQEVNHLRKRA